jgi:hypothetical protein
MHRYVYNFDERGAAINIRFVDSDYVLKEGEHEGEGDSLPDPASLNVEAPAQD